jgi:hypothetical protein
MGRWAKRRDRGGFAAHSRTRHARRIGRRRRPRMTALTLPGSIGRSGESRDNRKK